MFFTYLKNTTYHLKCKDPSEYDTCEPYVVNLKPGRYQFDCYGGSSANASNSTLIGYGAHVSGIIILSRPKTFFIYVGGQGSTYSSEKKVSPGGYNGGGNGGYGAYYSDGGSYTSSGCSGGGATDIRTIGGNWKNSSSLASRIMVAGAAGGWHHLSLKQRNNILKGGDGGGFNGEKALGYNGKVFKGGSQTNGYGLGIGQSGLSKTTYYSCGAEGNSGAGSGYYGGFASQNSGTNTDAAGSGGSSFISGYSGSLIVDDITFMQAKMIDGGTAKHLGDGVAIITEFRPISQKNRRYFEALWAFVVIAVIIDTS